MYLDYEKQTAKATESHLQQRIFPNLIELLLRLAAAYLNVKADIVVFLYIFDAATFWI